MSTKTFGPYSPVREVGQWLFVSGQVGVDPDTGIADKAVERQAVQALTNLQQKLGAHGSSLSEVVKTTVFLKNMNDFKVVNERYAEFFNDPYPARSCVEVAKLPNVSTDGQELLVEVEAVAYRGATR